MKTTKNITIVENQLGFVVRNNYENVKGFQSYNDAENFALKLGKTINKNVFANTDYIKGYVKG